MVGNNSIYIQDNVINDLEQDTFGHKHIADAVVNSILSTQPPFTIGIFGGWGTGKSSLLELINSKLKKEKIITVTIDAWRYSSAENLRRAFLVHVANELAPSLLDDLRRKLYTAEQETFPEKPSKIDKPKISFWNYILGIIGTFFVLAVVFVIILFIVFAIKTVIVNNGISEFFIKFDKVAFIDKFIDLAFVPFLLTLINYLRLYVIQRPITVIQERIDADELFSEYFEKVVTAAIKKNRLSKKELVLFVDNLDRLTDDKMVEALESLKTYLVNNNCVFVVACDDNVVRSVVNKSSKIPNISKENYNVAEVAGEHYLDKFFQQTFRLPEYMAINLSDFALKNIETTTLHKELCSQNIDIRNLVSIILPSNVNSPRKVKRLLNEFIALYEIVKRRENEKDGQLKAGMLTNNIEFLGKFSTIRAEYPVFYKSLIEDPTLISKITGLFQQARTDEIPDPLEEYSKAYSSSLIAYLRKTQTILVEDVDPYIWLSQDTLTLGLKGNHNNLLRTALSDGNIDQAKSLIENSDDVIYKTLIAKVASRIVEQRLIGIEQRNGVKVIAHLLPIFEDSIKPEIAHVATKLMPLWAIDTFSADEVLNILRWAQMGGINTQREKLVMQILDRLRDQQLRQPTFQAILQNANVIEQNNATQRVVIWLAEILAIDNQKVHLASEKTDAATESNEELDQNKINRDLMEWVIAQVEDYSGNQLVIRNYYSRGLVDYMVCRLLGDLDNVPAVHMDNAEGVGQNIQNAFNIISVEFENGLESDNYWDGLLRILHISVHLPDVRYSLEKIHLLMSYCPPTLTEHFFQNIFIAIRNQVEADVDKQITNEIISALQLAKNVILSLRSHKGKPFDNQQLDRVSEDLAYLLGFTELCNEILPLIETFYEKFGKDDSSIFMTGIVNAIGLYRNNQIIEDLLLDSIIKLDQFVTSTQKMDVLEKINQLFELNEIAHIETFHHHLTKIIKLEEYKGLIGKYINKWLEKLGPDAPPLLQKKLDVYNTLIIAGILDTNELISAIIPHIPFAGNENQLQIVMEAINRIRGSISDNVGVSLFTSIIANIGLFGSVIPTSLRIISRWIEKVDEPSRAKFYSQAKQVFPTAPLEIIDILSSVWRSMTEPEIQNQIIQFYTLNFEADARGKRDASVVKGLEVVSNEHRVDLIHSVWKELINQGRPAEQFMNTAIGFIPLDNLVKLRGDAIASVRENGASPLSEQNLRLLTVTIRKDVRDIMPIVELFVDLFKKDQSDVQMALKYIIPCLQPLDIRNDHKHKLAEAMGHAALQTNVQEVNDEIHNKADQLGLMWFSYRKYWKQ